MDILGALVHDIGEIDRLARNSNFRTLGGIGMDGFGFAPSITAGAVGKEYIISADVPGVKKTDINVDLTNGGRVITLWGQRCRRNIFAEEGSSASQSEQCSSFENSIRLPSAVAPSDVKADLSDGILTVTVPIFEPKRDSVSIKVRSQE